MPQAVEEFAEGTELADQEATEGPAEAVGVVLVALQLAVGVVQAAAKLAAVERREAAGQFEGGAPHLVEEVEGRVVPFALALRQPGDFGPVADHLAAPEEVELADPSRLLSQLAPLSCQREPAQEIRDACL